jgi:hypothetical protein
MKKAIFLGLIIIGSFCFTSCTKQDCSQSDTIFSEYDSINPVYINEFILDTSKSIVLKKYKSDSIMNFVFKGKTIENYLQYVNSKDYRCSTYHSYLIKHNYSYINQFDEPLIITQNKWSYSVSFRNITCSFWNGNLKTKTYQYDSISFSDNVFYDVFRSSEVYQKPADYAAYYNTKYGFLRLRLSLYDIWDIKL